MIAAVIAVAAVVLVALTAETVSELLYHRSALATLVEIYLRITERTPTEEEVKLEEKRKLVLSEPKAVVPKRIKRRTAVIETEHCGVPVFKIGSSGESAVLYFHGACYVRQPRKRHWLFAEKIAVRSGATVYMAVYPKAPWHGASEVYPKLLSLYNELRKSYARLIVMGDSSGGGLALGLTENLLYDAGEMPDGLVLISPLLDATLSNPEIERYQSTDPIVKAPQSRIWIKSWAKETPLNDYRLSPINGIRKGLCPVQMHVGTREILYPDCIAGAEKMKSCGVAVELCIGNGLNHCYPIYPDFIAKAAIKNMVKFISGDNC